MRSILKEFLDLVVDTTEAIRLVVLVFTFLGSVEYSLSESINVWVSLGIGLVMFYGFLFVLAVIDK